MNMDKNVQDYQVENMLENWQKKPLDDKALLAAQNRVWSKIETSISNSLETSNKSQIMPESNLENQSQNISTHPKPLKSWFLRPLGLSLISLSLVIILVGVTTTFYIKSLQSQLLQKQDQISQNINQKSQSTDPGFAKLDLSLDEIR